MGGITRSLSKSSVIALILTTVSACSLFEDPAKKPLEGERISILVSERTLTAAPELANATIILPAPTLNLDWPQSGGYPNHAMHHIKISDNIQQIWSTRIGSGANDETRLIGSPVISNGVVYTLDSETALSALNTQNGQQLWQTELTPEDEDEGHMSGGIAYDSGRLFVTTGFAQVIALNAKDGSVLWMKKMDAPMRSAPTVRGGRVFVLTVANELHTLNAQNGETLWSHTGISETASLLGGSSPAVDNGVVVVPYSSGELVALSVDKGRVLWQESISAIRRTGSVSGLSHIRGLPIIDRGRVIAISHSGMMAAIDLRSGRRIWDNQIGGMESPWVVGDYIFTLTNDAEIVAVSRDDGRIYWVRGLPQYLDPEEKEDRIVWTGPILASDRLLIAGSHGKVLAISPYTGQILGSADMPDGVTVPPVVAAGQVYFLANDAELIAYR